MRPNQCQKRPPTSFRLSIVLDSQYAASSYVSASLLRRRMEDLLYWRRICEPSALGNTGRITVDPYSFGFTKGLIVSGQGTFEASTFTFMAQDNWYMWSEAPMVVFHARCFDEKASVDEDTHTKPIS